CSLSSGACRERESAPGAQGLARSCTKVHGGECMEKNGWSGFKSAGFAHAFLGMALLLGFVVTGAIERSQRRGTPTTLSPDAPLLEDDRNGLRLVDRSTGSIRRSEVGMYHGTTFSPDSKEMMFFRSETPDYVSLLHIVDLSTGEEKKGPAAD